MPPGAVSKTKSIASSHLTYQPVPSLTAQALLRGTDKFVDVYAEITEGDSAQAVEAARSVANSMTNGLTRLSAKRERVDRIPRRGGCENDYAGVSAPMRNRIARFGE